MCVFVCLSGTQVLETLQAPVDKHSFNMKCITMGSGMRFVTSSLMFVFSVLRTMLYSILTSVISPIQQYVYDTTTSNIKKYNIVYTTVKNSFPAISATVAGIQIMLNVKITAKIKDTLEIFIWVCMFVF